MAARTTRGLREMKGRVEPGAQTRNLSLLIGTLGKSRKRIGVWIEGGRGGDGKGAGAIDLKQVKAEGKQAH